MKFDPHSPGSAFKASVEAALARNFFFFFLYRVFLLLHPGTLLRPSWYLMAMSHMLQLAAAGKKKRLVINVPPRHLKSISASVALPVWILGHNPSAKIMIVTYSAELARQHAEQRRQIMQHPFYKWLFPHTRLAPDGMRQQVLRTTAGGGCRSTTVGGSTTGFGADYIIIDDCMKADDIVSEARRDELDRFYRGTLLTRLNNKRKGVIISIQQRLGEDDLPARLLEAGAEHLCLPAYDDKEVVYELGFGRQYRRPIGEVLRPADEPREVLDQFRRDMGPRDFATQYLQLPGAIEGNIIRTERFARFRLEDFPRERFHYIAQSWDTATSEEPRADFSVCLTLGHLDKHWYLLDVQRRRMSYPALRDAVKAQHRLWKADKVLIEETNIGDALYKELAKLQRSLRPVMLRPVADKETRMVGQLGLVEDGTLLIPQEAPWLQDFLHEMRQFPTGNHDDQVDSLSQFLDWAKRNGNAVSTERDPITGRKMFVNRKDRVPRR